MNRPLIVIFTAIVLDAMGIGLVFPILPSLLQDVTHAENVAPYVGAVAALYAAMQFVFAPVLGALSDRLGRRPVLLISIGGAVVSYAFLAFAPNLWMLLIGRAVAGLTGANISVATAYITDISSEDKRARRFGLFNAMFGAGFIIGPVLGGALGDYWLLLPFIAAAALNACNFLLALLILRESRTPSGEKIDLAALNPLRPLRWVLSMKDLLPFILIFFVFSATGEAYGTCWALWGRDALHWNGLWIGLSLSAFGVCQTLAQAFLPGPAVKRLGELAAVLTGLAGACIALIVMAFATRSWMVLAIMPVFRPRRHRRSGSPVAGYPAGGREPAGSVSGRARLRREPRLDRRPARVLKLLFRRQGSMARRNLAFGRRPLCHWRRLGAGPAA